MSISRRKMRPFLPVALLVAALGACSEDSLGPEDVERVDVVGTYDATTLLVTEGGVRVNALALGAEAEITLEENGTTSGRLFVPLADEDGSDLEESLSGTFTFDEDTRRVTFDQEADTFVRDITLTAVRAGSRIHLEGTGSFEDSTVEIVLTRR